jgi:hypothetical protein
MLIFPMHPDEDLWLVDFNLYGTISCPDGGPAFIGACYRTWTDVSLWEFVNISRISILQVDNRFNNGN